VSQFSGAKIQVHLNTAYFDRNLYHFNCVNNYLFNVKYTSFNKTYSLLSEIWRFKSSTWKLQFPICECPLVT